MSRLIHLNGPPGIGKSTLARRYADEHPGVLCCDIDVLRTLVGGWRGDFDGAGALIRPAALTLIGAYLAGGHDVVLPQLITRVDELTRFRGAAEEAGAGFRHVLLLDSPAACVARFHARPPQAAYDEQVRATVADAGGDEALRRMHAAVQEVGVHVEGAAVVESPSGDEDGTYARVLDVLREPLPE